MISEYENSFGGFTNDKVIHLLIINVKDVIYQKKKQGIEIIED